MTIVLKFGGVSVATPGHFSRITDLIIETQKQYPKIAVVVSAMGETTDKLLRLALAVHPDPPKREQDMLVSVGERVSISLLAMCLARKGKEAISFTGSQSGIITTHEHCDAKIVEMRPHRLIPHLEKGKIVIVAGFQGVSTAGEITTLGRGGSDTSAVALGCALKAQKVRFYKDVCGIYSEDPKLYPEAKLYTQLNYEEALEIAKKSPILHPRAILLAQKNHLPLHITSFFEAVEGTYISNPPFVRENAS